jgi:hypothetical protein
MTRFANESSEQTEERIFAKLPDLKRIHKATEIDMRRERTFVFTKLINVFMSSSTRLGATYVNGVAR